MKYSRDYDILWNPYPTVPLVGFLLPVNSSGIGAVSKRVVTTRRATAILCSPQMMKRGRIGHWEEPFPTSSQARGQINGSCTWWCRVVVSAQFWSFQGCCLQISHKSQQLQLEVQQSKHPGHGREFLPQDSSLYYKIEAKIVRPFKRLVYSFVWRVDRVVCWKLPQAKLSNTTK